MIAKEILKDEEEEETPTSLFQAGLIFTNGKRCGTLPFNLSCTCYT